MHTDITPHTLPLILLINLLNHIPLNRPLHSPSSRSLWVTHSSRSMRQVGLEHPRFLLWASVDQTMQCESELPSFPANGVRLSWRFLWAVFPLSRGAVNIPTSRYAISFCETKNTNQIFNLLKHSQVILHKTYSSNTQTLFPLKSNSDYRVLQFYPSSYFFPFKIFPGHRSYFLTPKIKFY